MKNKTSVRVVPIFTQVTTLNNATVGSMLQKCVINIFGREILFLVMKRKRTA